MMRVPITLTLLLLVAGLLAAQTALTTSTIRGFQTSVGPQTIVRDSQGNLYVIYRDQFSPPQNDIAIGRSTDGGKTWNMKWQTGFAANASTDAGNISPCLAIDGQGNLHCAWLHQVPTQSRPPRTIRYNRYDAQTQSWGTEVVVTTARFELNYPALAVDSKNFVWFMHGTTAAGWKSVLDRSDKPYASDLKFSPVTPPFSSVASSQHPDLVIDALDRVHVCYYENGGTGGTSVKHQWMDPGATTPTWTFTPLGNTNTTADYYGSMAADLQGNVYIVYGVDVQGGKTQNPEWFIRKWDGASRTWGSAISFYKTTRSQWQPSAGANDGRVISAACDETTGEFYFVYRDVDAGELRLARWHDGDAAPTTHAKLMNTGTLPPNSRNYFLYPQLRGSLFPAFNRASLGLDLLYTVGDQTAPSPIYTLYYDPFPVGSLSSAGVPKIGTPFTLNLSAVKDANLSHILAFSLGGLTPGIGIDRRFIPLVPDSVFFVTTLNLAPTIFQNFHGVLNGAGVGQAQFAIPNLSALVGLKVFSAFITFPGGPAGIKTISNPFTFTITS